MAAKIRRLTPGAAGDNRTSALAPRFLLRRQPALQILFDGEFQMRGHFGVKIFVKLRAPEKKN